MIVYKATNSLNGKVYIRITTKTLEYRVKIHRRDSNRINTYFYKSIRKYGFEQFKWEDIDEAYSIEELHKKEIYYISKYESFDNKKKGCNTTSGGGSLYSISEAAREFSCDRKDIRKACNENIEYKGYLFEFVI